MAGSRASTAHLESDVAQTLEPRFFPIESTHEGLKGITAIRYADAPEPGMLTAITFGVSLGRHPDWRLGRPDLCITV
jgi:hypothetical protein